MLVFMVAQGFYLAPLHERRGRAAERGRADGAAGRRLAVSVTAADIEAALRAALAAAELAVPTTATCMPATPARAKGGTSACASPARASTVCHGWRGIASYMMPCTL